MSDVGFLTSPEYLIGFIPAVSCTWCIYIFYGSIPHNIWTYVTFLPTGTFDWWIKTCPTHVFFKLLRLLSKFVAHPFFPHYFRFTSLDIPVFHCFYRFIAGEAVCYGESVTIFLFG